MLRYKNNKPVVTLTIRDRPLSTNKSASSKDPSFISIFNRRISNIKRNVYQLDTENSEFYQSYSLSKSYLKYKDLTKIEFPVTKSILSKYLDCSTYRQEKHLILDVLQTEDPNGLVNIIQKLKRCINQFEVKGKVLDSKKRRLYFS